MFWNTLYATITAGLVALSAVTMPANAGSLDGNLVTAAHSMGLEVVAGPQSPRITNRMAYNNYQRCARFSLSVLQACMGQSNGDPRKQRSCRQHYQGNIVRCQRAAS